MEYHVIKDGDLESGVVKAVGEIFEVVGMGGGKFTRALVEHLHSRLDDALSLLSARQQNNIYEPDEKIDQECNVGIQKALREINIGLTGVDEGGKQ